MIQGRSINCLTRLACLAGAVLLPAFALAQPEGGPPAARVRVDPVRVERIERQRQVTGELRAVRRARVAAEHEGLVVEIRADAGDAVETGQVLARLDDDLMQVDLQRFKAERDGFAARVEELEARVAKARRDVERLESATGKGGVSFTELEDARLDLQAEEALASVARAELASAEARVRFAEQEIAKLAIRAPFSGAIVRKGIELGEWVSEGGEVFELVDTGVVDAWLDVPQAYIAAVDSSGAGVRVEIEAIGRTIESSDVAVIAEGDPLARTFPVRVRLANDDGALRPGMSVTGLVPTGDPVSAKTVHKDAILRDDAGTYVYADLGGQAVPVRVRRQWAVGDRVVVEAERLAPGMSVVIEGNERLFPTQPIVDVGASGEGGRGGPPGGAGGRGDGGGGSSRPGERGG